MTVPGSTSCVSVIRPLGKQLSVTVASSRKSATVYPQLSSALTVRSAGHSITGGSVSIIVTRKSHIATFPLMSVTSIVTVWGMFSCADGMTVPATGVCVKVAPPAGTMHWFTAVTRLV